MPLIVQKEKAWLFAICGLFMLFLLMAPKAQASHLRAGNIYAKSDTTTSSNRNPLRFFFRLVTYSVASRDDNLNAQVDIFFGDCTNGVFNRTATYILPNSNDTRVNIYDFEHTYAGPNTFTVTFIGELRNAGIANFSNSDQQSFFVQTTVTIDPFLGINRSPILDIPPIDQAEVNQVFYHNPGARDPDGDSLAFKLVPVRTKGGNNACGNPIPNTVPNFQNLDQFLSPLVTNPFFNIDVKTGQLTWRAPSRIGEFNTAFVVEEWRNGRLIGSVIRDMQIMVKRSTNKPPVLFIPRDTCIIASADLTGSNVRELLDTIRVTDPDKDPVELKQPIGAMFPLPASFTKVPNVDTAYAFSWRPITCMDVQRQPYLVVFRAEDNPPATRRPPLVDVQPWRITVVGPPPVLSSAEPVTSTSIKLTWNAYACANADKIYIYRKEGPTVFNPTACDVGIPQSLGYTLVGTVNANATEFIDAQGLTRNRTYCYRIYADFQAPKGGSSIASNELCASLESIAMTKVSVLETSMTSGRMRVEWSKPRLTNQPFVAPFRYRLLRAEGQSRLPSNTFTEVTGYTYTDLNDTVFTDTNLNTQDTSYTYRIEFYHSGATGTPTILVDSASASSVWLKALANGTSLELNWTYNVPWNNASTSTGPLVHDIYLKRPEENFILYESVSNATLTNGAFTKVIPLEEGKEYCAYVMTRGTYQNPKLPDPIENNSQIACVVNVCKPILTINPCEEPLNLVTPSYQNIVTWTLPTGCDMSSIAFYTLYYKATEDAPFQVIAARIPGATLIFTHQNIPSYAGCYAITATDFSGNTSIFNAADPADVSVECKDNCIVFLLPNIFTPNNDGKNDVFTPKQGAAFIKTAQLKVYNRWGNKVFEGAEEPGLNWKGVDTSSKALADGTYFYQVEIEFYGLSSTPDRRVFKGWVEIIH